MGKKSFLLGILFLMFISINVFGLTYGDVNKSGVVDVVDALITAQYCAGLPVSNFDAIAADVNAANGVTVVDALLIAQFCAKLIDRFPADILTSSPTPTPTPTSGLENLINGDFANDTAGWNRGIYSPAVGSTSVINGELVVNITDGGTGAWNVQISQGGINLIGGSSYTFSFDARSDATRTIEANVGMSAEPYTSYSASGPLSISTAMTHYSFTFTAPVNDATARVEFNCGLDANDVYLDNVSLIGGPTPTTGPTPTPVVVNFTDPNFEAAVRAKINIPDLPIYNTDVYTLTSLSLAVKSIADVNGLENFSGLTNLALNNNYILGISPLKNLTKLSDLNLCINFISDITPLQNLTDLTNLILSNNNLTDVTVLKNFTKLKTLNIGGNHISDLTPVQNLTNLTQLNLAINEISNISAVARLTNLTLIQLNCNKIVDITPLTNLTKLTYLPLYDNDIRDITPLANLTNLTFIDLSDNDVADITPLANLTKLTDLNLCNNPINSISALSNLTNLRSLVVNVKALTDITPLANLKNLMYLNLDNNSISDITVLKSLPNLRVLSIGGNPLNDSARAVIDYLRANGVTVAAF